MPLTREQIRERSKAAIKTKEVPVPEFGGETIRLRQMDGGAMVDYAGIEDSRTAGENSIDLLQRCAVDENNEPLWPGEEGVADIRALPGEVLGLLVTEARKLHGITDATVEEAAKN